MTDKHEVFSVRYGTVRRRRRDIFLASDDPHDAETHLDYYVWVIRGQGRVWLVDTGFSAEGARKRGREMLTCPIAALDELGLSADDVTDVIITHLHYDHAGNLGRLPNARIHIQEREVHYATGRHMCHDVLRHSFDVEDVNELIRKVYGKRVVFHNGDVAVADGIELLLVGGHTDGLQAVGVHTDRGRVVLASDAVHYYDNLLLASPYPQVFNVGNMMDGHARLLSLADSADHLIPGHDPAVHVRFPPVSSHARFARVLHQRPIKPLDSDSRGEV